MTQVLVIDASVALKWFREEEGSDKAKTLLLDLQEDPGSFLVPELFYFEMESALLRMFSSRDTVQAMDFLLRLGIYRHPMDRDLAAETAEMACRYKLTGYDASYVALAKLSKGKWCTFDSQAARRLHHTALCLDFS